MARTEIQLFACPACAKLYKRRVDIWLDLQHPRPSSSPSAQVPRICVCGRVFLLSESTVIANLSPTDRPGHWRSGPQPLSEFGMDQLDIPAFLRRRDDHDDGPQRGPLQAPPAGQRQAQQHRGLLARWFGRFVKRFRPKPKTKKDLVQSVLWDMEAMALPEKIAPTR